MRKYMTFLMATALCGTGASAAMAEDLSLQLNWKAGGDHAPIYYALEQGWYEEAGVDLDVRQGSGSGASAKALAVGQADLAIIDTPTALQFIGNDTPIKGVFVAYNDSPYGIYWKKSSGIETVADLKGRKIGAPAFDAARQMWIPIANALNLDPDSVEWVNLQPTAKVAALQSGAIDATTHFYSVHFIYEDVLGDDLGYALLRDEGLNPYGLAYFASDDSIAEKHDAIEAMVHVTQRAFSACLEDPAPCAKALSQAVSMKESDAARELEYASRVIPGIDNPLAIGEWDIERVAADYDLVEASFEITPFDPKTAVTNEFIDTSIKYPTTN
ncbi:ABC transporter substrate-binding protein [Martelella radicis]|uniref:NitT/TauT family transport system substrate-binding protein n=1 Tax=Martelella radicis TaxID=1397476 RepID=A0A7W6KQA9_9HYPH|nr:ABC transporter substrate-binding protein [Martelella radicis]MBB4124115.1 NitT/TauT family transport system substrate-binding protein [Martelella radicis]